MNSNFPTVPVADTPEENLKQAAEIAAVNLLFAQQKLGERLLDPTITTKGLLDIAEHSHKVSGMGKKVEANDGQQRALIQIILPGSGGEIVIGGGSAAQENQNTVAELAEAAKPLLDWGSAPEFVSSELADRLVDIDG